jgi:HD-GYP domain-containing protein (c-di-GMP phosphodiesterase class II)
MSEKSQLDLLTHHQLVKYAEDIARLYQDLEEKHTLLVKANQKLRKSYYRTILMGFDLISLHDEFLAGHCKRISHYSGILADALDIDKNTKRNTKLAGLLHDVGLIGIPRNILLTILSGTERSEEKLAIYRQHSNVNVRPLTSSEEFRHITYIISAHHENMDGSGFPKGLKGSEIPIESRIIAIVDVYDNVKQISSTVTEPEMIFEKMEMDGGSKYDMRIFHTFKKMILKEDPFHNTIHIGLEELTPGAILAKEIAPKNGIKLLGADTVLREDHIESIRNFASHTELNLPVGIYR